MEQDKHKTRLTSGTKSNIVIGCILAVVSMALALLLAVIFSSAGNNTLAIKANLGYIAIVGLLIFAMLEMLHLFYYYTNNRKFMTQKNLLVMLSIVVITLLAAISTMRFVSPYAVPLVMVSVLVCVLVNNKLGYIATTVTAMMAVMVFSMYSIVFDGRSVAVFSLIAQAVCGSIIAVLQSISVLYMVQRYYTRFKLIWGALIVGIVYAPLAAFTHCIIFGWEAQSLLSSLWQFVGNAIGVGIFTAILPIYESVFDVWTDFKLAEACSVSRPLLKRMSDEAPGTFNHCMQVSILAENCALNIGENPYFAKVCGIYHDIGKLSNAEFFVENQQGYNPHDDLIPEQSVKLITSHTQLGYKLLREHHMPEEIAIVAKEHHGTTAVLFFYIKAQSLTESEISKANFQYEGPKPTSKIAAIVMICDVVEAASRARAVADVTELRALVNSVIQDKVQEGQFSDCNITFQDLEIIKDTIVKVIPAIFHKRISYDIKK